ncbi:hypothetical protein FRC01_004907 [Tulasnella sp. 417]|nr:hypothetical protein FRC01_004907 [Tulasnella sp. 417]
MVSEPSRIDVEEQSMNVLDPKPPIEGDEKQREEQETKPSLGAELLINHPADATNQTSETTESSSKPSQSQSWWHFGREELLSPLKRRNRELESEVEQLTKALRSKEKENRALQSQLEDLTGTLILTENEHREELDEKGDRAGRAEEDPLFSLARNVAVRWVKDAFKAPYEGENKTPASDAHVEHLGEVIGVQLVNALNSPSLKQTQFAPLLLQLAWQASIVAVVKRILSCFSASLAASKEKFQIENALRAVATAVKGGEVQPAYGRWRLVTHHYLRQVVRGEDVAIRIYVKEALGLCHTATRLAMKNRCPDDESFTNALEPQMKEIVEEAFKLLTAIQEKMVTANYEPYTRENRRSFRSDRMTLGKQDSEYPDDHVVCSTGLGMVYSRKKGRNLPRSRLVRTYSRRLKC